MIGVILSGALSDGAAGLLAVRGAGGLAVIQEPSDALVAGMPRNASEIAGADHLVTATGLAALLTALAQDQATSKRSPTMTDPIDEMQSVVEQDMDRQTRDERHGEASVFICPECGGALWQTKQSELIQFRCHVGQVYNGDVLLSEQSEALEAAFWTAVRTFREKSILGRQLANHARGEGNAESAARFEEQAEQAARYGNLIRQSLLNDGTAADGNDFGFAVSGGVL